LPWSRKGEGAMCGGGMRPLKEKQNTNKKGHLGKPKRAKKRKKKKKGGIGVPLHEGGRSKGTRSCFRPGVTVNRGCSEKWGGCTHPPRGLPVYTERGKTLYA